MPYGYIPSPLGGRPSSVDIAKATQRDRVKDAYVRGARKTPMSRAELERTDKPTGLDYMGRTDSTELANDRLYRDENLLSEVNLASNTPYTRELKQDRENPNVQSVEDSRHADFDQHEYLDKSEDEPIDKADDGGEPADAMRTPMGRAREDGSNRYPVAPSGSDMVDYEDYDGNPAPPADAMRDPLSRAKAQADAKMVAQAKAEPDINPDKLMGLRQFQGRDEDPRYSGDKYSIDNVNKSESEPVIKSINQMIYDRTYGRSPYSIRK